MNHVQLHQILVKGEIKPVQTIRVLSLENLNMMMLRKVQETLLQVAMSYVYVKNVLVYRKRTKKAHLNIFA
jgi:hypothetical protein